MKTWKKMLYVMTLFLVLMAVPGKALKTEAATLQVECKPIYDADKGLLSLQLNASMQMQVQLLDAGKNVLPEGNRICKDRVTFSGIKKNRLYYYRMRPVVYDSKANGFVPAGSGNWSKPKGYCTAKYKVATANGAMKISCPKVNGVKSYTLYISPKNLVSSYKKVKTLAPGKTYTIKKLAGEKFKNLKIYYYKLEANLKDKTTAYRYEKRMVFIP